MKPILPLLLFAGAIYLTSCSEQVDELLLPQPDPEILETRSIALSPMEELGKKIFFDNISFPNKQSCATCHSPSFGYTGNHPGANFQDGIYRGAHSSRWGFRKPPSAAYASFSPVLYYDNTLGFIGGNNNDGSATGEQLGSPVADQALLPFLNPLEQNNMSVEFVLNEIRNSNYSKLWIEAWGAPIEYHTAAQAWLEYEKVAHSLAAYEASDEVNSFSSKFDQYLLGNVTLTPEELLGLSLFEGKAKCNTCHTSTGSKPLFTNFTYHNMGIPKNPSNPYYGMSTVYWNNGEPINPLGSAWIDYGLGGFLQDHPNPVYQSRATESMGKFKVPTLRNVAKKNGGGNSKAYMHNGVFKSLDEVVHFFNTRDTETWPAPEVPQNINTTDAGNLGLTLEEEKAIVAFLNTLSDGYRIR